MRRRPIGQILVEKGEISEVDLQAALTEQERSGRRLGEILIEQGRTSWLALARAIAEQLLDYQNEEPQPEPAPGAVAEAKPDPVAMVRELAERVANLPPVPDPLPPPEIAPAPAPAPVPDPEHELARAVAEQVANLDSPAPAELEPEERHVLRLTPTPHASDPDQRLLQIEALLKERQRAFMELVTTAETLRTKIARLEEMVDERDKELTRLRVVRAS
jgi:outer membrane biosynthesis protein TonB